MSLLGEPLRLGSRTARNRIFFGPHETNLAAGRAVSERHVAYYVERARGGAGVVVIEEASVDETDWPYERAPLASLSVGGWAEVAAACHRHGALVLAAIGHTGSQGESSYHQRALLGPSNVPDVVTREMPKEMEEEEIASLIASYARAAQLAGEAGLDGVEVNAGQWSLVRQFASGLTNRRADRYGADRGVLADEVISAVRAAAPALVVGLRASCDELAPWAGIVPDEGALMISRLAGEGEKARFDYVTVVRGSAFWTGATRPDGHTASGFNAELSALVRESLRRDVAVVAQGSIVDCEEAASILSSKRADAVEMTRAQIADPHLARKAVASMLDRVRPCVLCNQECQVRDARNPIVSCVVEPRSGHETTDPRPPAGDEAPPRGAARSGRLVVVGGGPAGLECALVARRLGLEVLLVEREEQLGGMLQTIARLPGRERFSNFSSYLEAECRLSGVEMETCREVSPKELSLLGERVVIATGSRTGGRSYEVAAGCEDDVVDAEELFSCGKSPHLSSPSPKAVWDPVGGPLGVASAEVLAAGGAPVVLVTPDFVAGTQLARSGDLAPANTRLLLAGVRIAKHCVVERVAGEGVVFSDRFTGESELLTGGVLVDAGFRLPDDSLFEALGDEERERCVLVGDALAPRTVYEAVREGRRAAYDVASSYEPARAR